jgi:hypothetical protein
MLIAPPLEDLAPEVASKLGLQDSSKNRHLGLVLKNQ